MERGVLELRFHPFDLPLKHPFAISRGTADVQPTLIVELSDGVHRGFGEATSNPYYGVTIAGMQAAIERIDETLRKYDGDDPTTFFRQIEPQLADAPFALCAVDMAVHDLWGKRNKAPVYRLWGYELPQSPLSSFTIGIDDVETMIMKLHEEPDWPIYKVKLGTDHDLDIIRRLREHTEAPFRVDANCAWSVAETVEKAGQLKRLGVEFIEQPLPADDREGQREVYRRSPLPLMADESCLAEPDVAKCQGLFHGVNVKLVKCGGLTPARRMLQEARQLGLKTMVGCMTESSVGISAAAQLLPLLDYVDIDGAELLAKDVARGVRVERGRCRYPDAYGNGVSLI
ncbi:MAG: dipeptide epimerase [Planctomycetota bacterium]